MNGSNLIKIAAVVVALLALLGGAWVLSQRTAVVDVQSDVISREDQDLGNAQVLLKSLKNAQVIVPNRPHDHAELHDKANRIRRLLTFSVSTNLYGIRGPDFQMPSPGYRILALGDSVTFGWGVTYEESYPALLGKQLGVEVLNAGFPAMKPRHLGRWMKKYGKHMDVDLVLFARRPDQGTPTPDENFAQAIEWVKEGAGDAPVAVILPPLSTFDPNSHTLKAQQEAERIRQVIHPVPVLEMTDAFRAVLPQPGVTMSIDGQEQVMTEYPSGEELARGVPGKYTLAEEIVAVFESDPEAQKYAEPLLYDGGHPDAQGFKVFTRAVVKFLEDEGLWPPPQPAAGDPAP